MLGRRTVVFALLAAFGATAALAGPSLSFKFYGGAGFWPTGGDLKELFESTAARWEHVGYTGTYDLDWKPLAFEGGIQAVLGLTPRLGLALGVGYLNKTVSQGPRLQTSPQADLAVDRSYRLSAFPVTLDAVYAVATGSFRLNVFAGAGLYPAAFDFESQSFYTDDGRPTQPNWTWDVREGFDSETVWTPGVQFGLGAETGLSEKIFLCIDVLYRLASFDDVVGRWEWEDVAAWTGGGDSDAYDVGQATVWYEESLIWGTLWHYMDFSEEKPTTSDDARPFKFDLGGPVIRIGVRIGI